MEELYGAGVVDGVERKALLAPIEKRERMLQRRGAVWRTPRVMDVSPALSSFGLPSHIPTLCDHMTSGLLHAGVLLPAKRGQSSSIDLMSVTRVHASEQRHRHRVSKPVRGGRCCATCRSCASCRARSWTRCCRAAPCSSSTAARCCPRAAQHVVMQVPDLHRVTVCCTSPSALTLPT